MNTLGRMIAGGRELFPALVIALRHRPGRAAWADGAQPGTVAVQPA